MSGHTPGPLTVVIEDKRLPRIVTLNTDGEAVFSTEMPCHSSKDNCADDTINCKNFPHDVQEAYSQINKRAIADEVLRAAAPDLLAAMMGARKQIATDRKVLRDCHMNPTTGVVDDAHGIDGLREYDAVLATIDAAIAKATGEVTK